MKVKTTNLEGVIILMPEVNLKGEYFFETYNLEKFRNYGVGAKFIQEHQSFIAQKGTIRGIHFQLYPKTQSKLIYCLKGAILDVAIDLRKESVTYRKWIAEELSENNFKQLYIPRGFGHAFITLTDNVIVYSKEDNYFSYEYHRAIKYNDPDIHIKWPNMHINLSHEDYIAPYLNEINIIF